MRVLIFLCNIALLFACRNEAENRAPTSQSPKKNSKYAGILAKCKPITVDTFRVHCDDILDDTFGISVNYPFKGVLLDSVDAALFPIEVAAGPMGDYSGMYACYSFAIDDRHTAIIARTPAMYGSTSIKLFTLDDIRDTLTDFTELATFEGDDGASKEKTSWLYKDQNRKLNAYMWELETYDHSVQDEGDTTIEKDNYHYVLNLSNTKFDTSNRNAGNLLKIFQSVNQEQEYR